MTDALANARRLKRGRVFVVLCSQSVAPSLHRKWHWGAMPPGEADAGSLERLARCL